MTRAELVEKMYEAYHNCHGDMAAALDVARDELLKAKTPEERVMIQSANGYPASVFLDGAFLLLFENQSHAETYRLGLIQQLKEGAK